MAMVEEGPQERGYARAVVLGTVIGIPVVFLIALLVALPGAGWPDGLGIAAVPAFFGGPLFGGFAMVIVEVGRWERQERQERAPRAASADEASRAAA